MLPQHLIVKTAPIAAPENIYSFGDYRITLLFDRLFRIEKNAAKEFCDDATQSIWYRNMPRVEASVTKTENYIEIKTAAVTLHLEENLESSFVIIDGKSIPVNNDENLYGTTRTLDEYNGDAHVKKFTKLKLNVGVCSKNGVAVIDDTDSLRLLEGGRLAPKSSNEKDLYLFAYGNEYREAVRALYAISGSTPLLPRYSFGNWWSRYHEYSADEYLWLMDKFEEYGIPFTVATVDMDWHYSNNVDAQKQVTASGKYGEFYGTVTKFRMGWTGYSWNKDLFPDYKAFLKGLHDRNLKVTLNLHPADGVRYFEDMYEEMALAMGIDPKTEEVVKFDIANDDFVKAYFEILHHPYEKDGVDFWWMDWQQGSKSAMEGLDPLWALNHYHYYDNGRDGKHALIMSRYSGIGSHRYPIGFSGDTVISWETLKYIPYFTSTATNAGYTWWGHDIGGHYKGIKDDELYLRFLQFGVFNPFLRLHSSNALIFTKEPWAFKNGVGELSREALIFRHRMIPMLYTANKRTADEGLGLVEPMYYEYPNSPEAYEADGQYIFAGDYIVAPITEHSVNGGLSKKSVWLPEGRFTDIFTGTVYTVKEGGEWIDTVRTLDSIPAFAKAGTILPLGLDAGNSPDNPKSLELKIYNGNGSYTLYEDNEVGVASYMNITSEELENVQRVRFNYSGDSSVLPEKRDIKLTFENITVNTAVDLGIGLTETPYANVTVLKNGEAIEAKVSKYGTVTVTIKDIDYSASYECIIEYYKLPDLCYAKRALLMKILEVEGVNVVRGNFERALRSAESVSALRGMIEVSDFDSIDKIRLKELLHF